VVYIRRQEREIAPNSKLSLHAADGRHRPQQGLRGGGIGLTTDLPIEKMWRQQRSYRITEGASEVMKMVVARHVLKTY
jgi:alkylation response protein AidB-like acyl-CoA dehydrogenase